MVRDDGGPAFPEAGLTGLPNDEFIYGRAGMSLRDYFAAKAAQGLLANPGGPVQASGMSGWSFTNCDKNDVATLAYVLADAMLKERQA